MSEDVKGSSGTPDNAASGDNLDNESSKNAASGDSKSKEGLVARETYLKTLGEAKNAKAKLNEVMTRLEELEQDKLSAEGNKDQLIDALRKQIDKEKNEKQTLAGNFVETALKSQFKEEAMRQGIKKPEIMDRLVKYEDFVNSVDTTTFKADETDIKSTVEQVKSEFPELFGRKSPNVNNTIEAADGGHIPPKKIDYSKLTREEADRLAEELDRQSGKRSPFVSG